MIKIRGKWKGQTFHRPTLTFFLFFFPFCETLVEYEYACNTMNPEKRRREWPWQKKKRKRKSAVKGYSFLLRIRIEIPPSKKKNIFIHVSLILCILFPLIVGKKRNKKNWILLREMNSIETSKLIEIKKKTYKKLDLLRR